MQESEDQLLSSAILGDREALAELVARHGPTVRKSLEGKIDAKWQSLVGVNDVMQETYSDAMHGIARFESRGPNSFVRWLHTLARNNLLVAIQGLQAAKRGGDRIRVDNEQESAVGLFEMLGGTTTSPSGKVAFKEARAALDRAFEKMPEHYCMVVSLYDLAGCSVKDVCEACQCNQGAMFMRRARAHGMLRTLLGSASGIFG